MFTKFCKPGSPMISSVHMTKIASNLTLFVCTITLGTFVRTQLHCILQFSTNILAWEFVTRSCLKPRNPCSNHEIHVLFEHGFYLKKRKLGPDMHACRDTGKRCGRD